MTSSPSVPPERLRRPGGEAPAGAVPGQRSGAAGRTSSPTGPPDVPGVTVLAELGRGASTVVYRVRRGGAEYALKVLDRPPDPGDAGAALTAFRREAALLASIDHPGLPRVHEVGEAGGRPYLVADLVAGRPLSAILEGGPLPEHRAVGLAEDLAAALAAVHRTGLAHGDVRPRNVLVSDAGEARLVHVDLATQDPPGQVRADGTDREAFAAPELAGAGATGHPRRADGRSDLWSLGAVLFACLTGSPPGRTGDRDGDGRPPDPRELRPGVSEAISRVVGVLLATDPDARYAAAEDLAADLHRAARSIGGFRPTPLDVAIDRGTETPLCGRDVEFARLADAWGRASDGAGGVVLVRGATGVGKTRVALELAGHARGQGALVLHGAAAADDPVPLAPLRAGVDAHLQAVAALPAAERDAELTRLRSAAGPAADLLGRLSPRLAKVLGAGPGAPGPSAAAAAGSPADGSRQLLDDDRREQFATAVSSFLVELARSHGGLLLLLDDVHWLDHATRRVLRRLAPELGTSPLLVVATAREESATALGVPAATDIVLGPLDEDGVRALVSAHLPGIDRGSELARLLTVRAHGNPFVVREYLRAIVDAGLLRPAWGTWLLDAGGLDALDLPRDAAGLVLARVAGLGPGARRVLATAAAVGVRFRPELVAEVCGLEPARVRDLLAQARTSRLVEARDGGDHAFVHERVREALVADLAPAALADLHAAIAAALDLATGSAGRPATAREPGGPARAYAVAHHWLQAGTAADPERVAAACAAAAAAAAADHAPAEAVRFYEHAAAAGHPADAAFLLGFGTALARAGRWSDALVRLREALRPGTPPPVRAAILTAIAEASRASWDADGARAAVDGGLAALGRRLPRHRTVLLLTSLLHFAAGLLVRASRRLTGRPAGPAPGAARRRLELAAALHATGGYVGAASLRPDVQIAHHLRASLVAARLGSGAWYARSTCGFAFLLEQFRAPRASARAFRRAEAAATGLGDPWAAAMVAWYRGCAAYLSGRDSGETWLRAVEEHGRWLDIGHYGDAVATVGWELAMLGRTADVAAWHERGRQRLAAAAGERSALLTLGPVTHTMTGRTAQAAEGLDELAAALAGGGGLSLRVNLVLVQLHALLEKGELGEPFEEVVAAFRALGMNPSLMMRQHRAFFALHAWGRLAQCRRARGEQRPIRLSAARDAIVILERVANTPALSTAAKLTRADLHLLEGRPQRALRLVSGLQPLRPDAPLLAFETARVRARACLALELREEADRLVGYAREVATTEHWPNRLRWLEAEFGAEGGGPAGRGRAGHLAGPATARNRRQSAALRSPGDGGERRRTTALAELARASAGVLDPETLARRALDATARLLAADRAALYLPAGDGAPDLLPRGLVPYLARDTHGGDVAPPGRDVAAVVEQVRVTGAPQVVAETDRIDEASRQEARSVVAAPLRLEGRLLGVLCLESRVSHGVFTADDAQLLDALTTPVAAALETARAAAIELAATAASRRQDVAEGLRAAFDAFAAATAPRQVLRELVAYAGHVLPADRAWLVPPDGTEPPRPVTGAGGRGAPAAVALDIPSSWSWLAVPVRAGRDSLGVLVVCSPAPDAYREAELGLAGALVTQAVAAYENAVLRQGRSQGRGQHRTSGRSDGQVPPR